MKKRKKIITFEIPVLLGFLFLSACISNQGKTPSYSQQDDKGGSASTEDSGFVSIFDGKTLDRWEGDTLFWKVENGTIVGEETAATAPVLKANTFLVWKGGSPKDFEIKAEYKISENGNSGIQYRSEMVEGVPFGMRGYQLDIDGTNKYTGQNYEERGRTILAFPGQKVTLPDMPGPIEEYAKGNIWTASVLDSTLGTPEFLKSKMKEGWNTLHIIAKGNRLKHYVNDVLMCDVTDNDLKNRKMEGLIGLQLHKMPPDHPMKVAFRNIKLKELK